MKQHITVAPFSLVSGVTPQPDGSVLLELSSPDVTPPTLSVEYDYDAGRGVVRAVDDEDLEIEVEILVGGQQYFTGHAPLDFDTEGFPPGPCDVVVTAQDDAGNQSPPRVLQVSVKDREAPSVWIDNFNDQAGTGTVQADDFDPTLDADVYLNGMWIGSGQVPYDFDVRRSTLPPGTYEIRVVVKDSDQNANDANEVFTIEAEPPPPPTGDAHQAFEELSALPGCVYAYSLRDQAQVNALTKNKDAQSTWIYDPAHDDYHSPIDGLKLLRLNPVGTPQEGKASIPQGDILFFPEIVMAPDDRSLLIAWEQTWGREYRDNCGGVTHAKVLGIQISNSTWWTNMQSPGPTRNSPEALDVASLTDEFHTGLPRPAGMIRGERVLPSGPGTPSQYPSYHTAGKMFQEQIVRFVLEIRPIQPPEAFEEWNRAYAVTVGPNPQHPSGGWHMVSKWMVDEVGHVHRLLYKVPMAFMSWPANRFAPRITVDSSKDGFVGPWIGYFRNVVVLKNYRLPDMPEQDAVLFQRPQR